MERGRDEARCTCCNFSPLRNLIVPSAPLRYRRMALISLRKVTSITLIASRISSKHLRTSAGGEDSSNKLEKIHWNRLAKSMEVNEDTSLIFLIKLLI